MNIYHIKWISGGVYGIGLCAVVIAQNEIDVLKELDLEHDHDTNTNIRVSLIGTTKAGLNATQIVCRECL